MMALLVALAVGTVLVTVGCVTSYLKWSRELERSRARHTMVWASDEPPSCGRITNPNRPHHFRPLVARYDTTPQRPQLHRETLRSVLGWIDLELQFIPAARRPHRPILVVSLRGNRQ